MVRASLSYSGVAFVFGQELHHQGADALLGAALVFGSAISCAIYRAFSGAAVQRLGALRPTGLATTVACLLCILQFIVLRPMGSVLSVAPVVLWLSVLNATACTFAPVLMVVMAIERVGTTLAAQKA